MRTLALFVLLAVGCQSWRPMDASDIDADACLVMTRSRAYELRPAHADESGVRGRPVRAWRIEDSDVETDRKTPDDLARSNGWTPVRPPSTFILIQYEAIQRVSAYQMDARKVGIGVAIAVALTLVAGAILLGYEVRQIHTH